MELFKDGFNHYGHAPNSTDPTATVVRNNMQAGPWARAAGWCGIPPWGARTDSYSYATGTQDDSGGLASRRVLGGSVTALIVSMGFSVSSLPETAQFYIIKPRDSGNNSGAGLLLNPDGTVVLETPIGTAVGSTQTPVIRAQTWHALEMEFDFTAGTFRLDVDGTTVMSLSGLTYLSDAANNPGFAAATQIAIGAGVPVGGQFTPWFSDLIARDTTGSRNNGFEGDVRVATLFPDADAPAQGWTARPLKKIANGVLDNTAAIAGGAGPASGTRNNTTLNDLGAGDYTIETFVRFLTLPTGTDKSCIFGKWDESSNNRGYQLYLGGSGLDSGAIAFRTSTDGQAGTVAKLLTYPWLPLLNVWYHVALVRASGELLLFIDGIQQGLPIADTTVPFAASVPTIMGGQSNAGGVSSSAGSIMNGWFDEARLTVGYARYTSDFTPTTVPFPRNVGGDPQFADVTLLCGFDSGVFDESSYGLLMTAAGGSLAVTPDDGQFNFQDINAAQPRDYTFIEAALVPAFGVYSQTPAQPSNNETLTVGTVGSGSPVPGVYTFKTALTGAALEVLIGATIANTLANVVAAINNGPGAGTVYGAGTAINNDVLAASLPGDQFQVTAVLPGTGGNSLAVSTTAADGFWDGATLHGGLDIPTYSEFYFQRPPPDTTVIKSITIVNRSFKSDTGTCTVQASFVGPGNGVLNGADNALTTAPNYREDIFETDPDTSGDIAVTSVVSGRVRLDRTS